jgi:hypothetical protein
MAMALLAGGWMKYEARRLGLPPNVPMESREFEREIQVAFCTCSSQLAVVGETESGSVPLTMRSVETGMRSTPFDDVPLGLYRGVMEV